MNIGDVKNALTQLLNIPICLIQATVRIDKQIEKSGFISGLAIIATDDTNIEMSEQMISF
jgi:hypothetical protein